MKADAAGLVTLHAAASSWCSLGQHADCEYDGLRGGNTVGCACACHENGTIGTAALRMNGTIAPSAAKPEVVRLRTRLAGPE